MFVILDPAGAQRRPLRALHSERLGHLSACRRGSIDLLRLCRLRRGLDRGRGNREPATQRADRPDRVACCSARSSTCWSRPARSARIGAAAGARALRGAVLAAGLAGTGRPVPRDRRRRRDEPLVCSKEALAHVLRSIGYRADRRPDGHCRLPRAAVGRADDDVRPDPHLLRHGARRPASGAAGRRPPEVPHAAHRDGRSPASS